MFLRHCKTRFSLSGAALGVGTTLCGFVFDCARPWSTDSRSALPGLNFRTCRAGISTLSPFLGLRPKRGACWVTVKLPNPRMSMRLPAPRALLRASKIVLAASSVSASVNCPKRPASALMSLIGSFDSV